ncbi:EamA family transporter RarD [Pseudoclavibacter sp. CFCC 14310]|uniref:EamA family transporter RarD n=1 Tax=Pseudoclavibacter sp. CFCC 14310 TaxID=2615180 RepID=UPI0013017716|nr:EamA family transporter RarD [Pseudoclavibacter sp. CFCC 14310]KAB1645737.1 EamA family transporter RarD [Pseudoclavibacter sp. CFCC 14310]
MAQTTKSGVSASVSASVMFGLISLLTSELSAFTSEEVTAWRIVCIVVLMAVFFTVHRDWDAIGRLIRRILHDPRRIVVLLGCSAMVTAQIWVFIWGPMHGHALDVSLGYFLMPLVVVAAGRFLFKDRLDRWQWAAVALAAVAVIIEVLIVGGFSWPTALVGFGYPVYFAVRRAAGMDDVRVFWLEMLLAAPFAVWLLSQGDVAGTLARQAGPAWWSFVALGVLSGVAMMLYILASGRLNLTLFGMLSYLEPVLLFAAALLLGEQLLTADLFVYTVIAAALACMLISGLLPLLRRGRSGRLSR